MIDVVFSRMYEPIHQFRVYRNWVIGHKMVKGQYMGT